MGFVLNFPASLEYVEAVIALDYKYNAILLVLQVAWQMICAVVMLRVLCTNA